MKRYHQERERTRREHRFHLRWVHNWPERPVDCVCELQAGRFRKKKALDCGRSRCLVCHFDKVLGIPSHKDRIRRLRFKDSLDDCYASLDEIDDRSLNQSG
ncbi:MAG: hypothetical protein AB1631_23135 [Acidobacteriota bacterium]